ncbi:hypothetical protein M8542_36720 [Amycolatopsis sp. OK19-0408]|uniref:Uncharacterized protein n=1 Tax=Amycolatopsis iheyensis TaxID=2945988 RepID=A0A9X2NKS2_9PSEU|nr:hypothetical protein [Amycolatopsis iheyensis]MCR6488389.1 hypothetical protein [Amycolatopsis iheyensis]
MTDLVARYWDMVLPTGMSPLPRLPLPAVTDRVDPVVLAGLLADPRCLDGFGAASGRRRTDLLAALAVWLEHLPAHLVPEPMRSRAARLRFVVWSLPFRLRALGEDADVLPERVDPPATRPGDQPPPPQMLQVDQAVLLLARTAREEWLSHLRAWQDDPWLSAVHHTDPARFEWELRWVTHAWPDDTAAADVRGRRLALVARRAGDIERGDDQDRVAGEVAEHHWLPRAALPVGSRASGPGGRRRAAAFGSLALAPLLLYAAQAGQLARWVALAQLAVGMVAVIAARPRRDALLLLRLPAASAAGALVLLSFTPRWWLDPDAWRVGLGLLAVSMLYLIIETRLHGVPVWAAVRRGTVIGLIGAGYAMTLSILILGFAAPSVAEDGQCLLGWWQHPPYTAHPYLPAQAAACADALHAGAAAAPAGFVLLLTGWSLAVGLAAQVLWDDRPVTAPLGRLKRTRGGPS